MSKKLKTIAARGTVCEYELAVDDKGNIYAIGNSPAPCAMAREIDAIALAVAALKTAHKTVQKVERLIETTGGDGHELCLIPGGDLDYISVGCQQIDYDDVLKIHAASLKARGKK